MRSFSLSLVILTAWVASTEACSCRQPLPSRDQSIRSYFRDSSDIYTATVNRANCKCFNNDEDRSDGLVSCIRYELDAQGTVQRNAQVQYSCNESDFQSRFESCSSVTNKTAVNRAVAPLRQGNQTLVNATCRVNFSETGHGCDLTIQPCYYIVSVGEVFKGNYSRGQSLSLPGPDVLTSCGVHRRVLALGVEYVAGIGGGCSRASQWGELSSYSTSEMQLIRDLGRICTQNPSSSVCSGTAAVMGMGLLTVLLATAVAVGFL